MNGGQNAAAFAQKTYVQNIPGALLVQVPGIDLLQLLNLLGSVLTTSLQHLSTYTKVTTTCWSLDSGEAPTQVQAQSAVPVL